ncbi:MAG: family peptidase [Sphingobacteriaceae bacterium]|jgi:hypothetical protein|nr:family peptidase [Sphingobacteriaceae bacterium]
MKKYLTLLLLFTFQRLSAQESIFARKIVDTLTSKAFWGRGYTKDGMAKAAGFLASQFKSDGLQPLAGNNYLQPFSFPVNTFPGAMEVSINGKKLVPGKDFIVRADSKGVKFKGKLVQQDTIHFANEDHSIVVSLENKLTMSVASEVAGQTIVQVDKKALAETPKRIEANIEIKFIEAFAAANVCGLVKGTSQPDSIIAITAHYDHLGGMGKDTYFPGANDNASGISLLLGLAKYYAANPPKYSMMFICFAGEEAGLLGSNYFVNHPLVDLSKIRFLTNVDLVGTGTEGATVVNATIYPKEFALLNEINNEYKYLVKIASRGKAANSDHYWFTEKGVPSFFLYTMGGPKAYHDVFDRSATLPLNEYNDLLQLLIKFNNKLSN